MDSTFSQNYFEIFGLPVNFEVDTSTLSTRYRDLQKAVHPDRFASASDQERRIAVQQAAHINEAQRVLKSPLERAKYMLSLRGIHLDEETDTRMDPAFLMQQMELRESLESASSGSDPMSTLSALLKQIETDMNDMISELGQLFEQTSDEANRKARDTVRKMQFMHKLRHEVEELEENLI